MTSFAQVSDNTFARALSNSLNNATSPITLGGIDTRRFETITTGYIVTIWDDVTYPNDPALDGQMEKAVITADTVGISGSLTLTRPNAKTHTGTPIIAALVVSQHIKDHSTAINTLETKTSNIDNTSDLNKPISTATQTALNTKANTSSLSSVATSGSYTDLSNKPTIPTNNNQLTNGAGYITSYSETDPVFVASQAHNITGTHITTLGNTSGINSGDETATTIKGKLGVTTLSGSNTGDQTIPTSLPPNGTAGGDLTGTYPNPTLASVTTGATVGSASAIPIITYDAKGRITTATTAAISGGGTVTNVSSATADATVTNPTTTPAITIVSAPKLTTARNINGVAFDGTANITVADSTKEPTISAGTSSQYYRGDKSMQTLNQDVVPDGTTNKAYTATEKTKLAGIATGATANVPATYTVSGTVLQREYNVRDYGATGNGSTDDTTSINNALAAAATAGGGIVFVPPGNYMVSSNLLVLSNVTLEGAGFSSRIFLKANTTLTNAAIVLAKDITSVTRVTNFVVRGLQIDGNKANQSGSPVQLYGFYCEADSGIVENCWVHDNLGYGIDPHGTGGVTDKTKRLIVRDNFVYNNGTVASIDYDGITLDTITYGTVSGNVVYSNARNGINLTTSGSGVSVIGNSVYSNGLDGIVMQNSSTGSAIVGNEVFSNTGNGIIISNVNYAAISANMISGNGSSGINLYRSSYNSVSGNTLVNNSQTTNNGFSDIYLNDDGTTFDLYNSITGNTISATATNKSKYGIEEKTASSDFNTYSGNVVTGTVTGATNLKGVNRTEYLTKTLSDTITDGKNIALGTTTGTQIGTATGQKLGFFGTTPAVQQGATAELGTLLATLGIRASGSAYTISTSGQVSFSGNVKLGFTARTGTSSLTTTSSYGSFADATTAAFTITLPTAVGNANLVFKIIKIDASVNAVTVGTTSSQNINAATTFSLPTQFKYVEITSNGTQWYVTDNN